METDKNAYFLLSSEFWELQKVCPPLPQSATDLPDHHMSVPKCSHSCPTRVLLVSYSCPVRVLCVSQVYSVVYDMISKNLEKILNPRGQEDTSLRGLY